MNSIQNAHFHKRSYPEVPLCLFWLAECGGVGDSGSPAVIPSLFVTVNEHEFPQTEWVSVYYLLTIMVMGPVRRFALISLYGGDTLPNISCITSGVLGNIYQLESVEE